MDGPVHRRWDTELGDPRDQGRPPELGDQLTSEGAAAAGAGSGLVLLPAKEWDHLRRPATAPLRCHLLIGQPASGKSTLARSLAPLLSAPGDPPAVVLSTDRIRQELFGDAAVQGPWIEIQQRLHQRIQEAVAAGIPVIVDATHARRAWRLALTQGLPLPRPVEWIGWWLTTPLATSLEWNQRRERPVPVPVIQEMAAALADPHLGPCLAEGFAALCELAPRHQDALEAMLRQELAALDKRIRAARLRRD
jgi:predicted kinase